jgi:hypothetical protein
MQLQQTEIALTAPSEHDWYRGAVRKLASLDGAWLIVLLCYCAIFGGILVYSNFLPYTFDNNESFSAFWHGRNMYEYGIANSSGLADESFLTIPPRTLMSTPMPALARGCSPICSTCWASGRSSCRSQ